MMGDVINLKPKDSNVSIGMKVSGDCGPIMEITRGDRPYLIVYADYATELVRISLKTGTVEIKEPGKLPEAAEQFWRAVATFCPLVR
jgi:hypothetical protein